MRACIYNFYHKMQNNKWFIGLIAWLQQHYITIFVGDIVNFPRNLRNRSNPSRYLNESRSYFSENENRVNKVKRLLADDQSRMAYEAAIKFRTEARRIRKNEWSLRDQYFVEGIIELKNGEVFVDGGAYNGDTIDKLITYRKRYYKNIHIKRVVAFEPGSLNAGLLQKKYAKIKNVLIVKAGLSDKDGKAFFTSTGSSSHVIDDATKGVSITLCAIDNVPECTDTTFIKLDIEGAEWEALHGAEKTIQRNKPKLAICIYHSDEDMIRLVEYVHELVPEYKLYVRHHTRRKHETVLYAVMQG